MAWNPNNLIKAAEAAGVKYDVDSTWLDVDPYGDKFQPVGVVWHHTACGSLARGNMPSLGWCRNPGPYAGQARACHIVVGRDGALQIIAGKGAYHAGAGGPLKVNGTLIPKDLGNRYLIGIEIEASSTTKVNAKDVQTPKWGMNPAQLESVSKFCAALFDIMKWDTEAAIRHRDWAPGRKIDVGISLDLIREQIKTYRAKPKPPTPPAPTKPTAKPSVKLPAVQPGKRNKDVALVQKALKKEVGLVLTPASEGHFNAATKAAYKKWQQKLGYKGSDADGVPGIKSLTALGKKHGFTVKPA